MRAMDSGNGPTGDASGTDIDPTISCAACEACCCRLEVLLAGGDDPPARFVAEDAWGGATMRREDDGWCAALDRNTMRCTIYARRPAVCREFPTGSYDCIAQRVQWLPARGPTA
jgi:Fe-S-cluster containining protein